MAPATAARARPDTATTALVLAVGLVAVSSAAVLIRLADAPSLAIAAWRMTFAAVVVAAIAVRAHRRELATVSRPDGVRMVAAGALLAAHFALWISSLDHTSVASSVALVTTSPLWVGLAAPIVLGETVGPALWAGITAAFVGGAIIGVGDLRGGPFAPAGDLMALGGAWAAAGYFLAGRAVRARVSLVPYVAVVYGTAALMLLAVAVFTGTPLTGYDGRTWALLGALALGPQLIGHSSLNWALADRSATLVAGTVLGEAVGSTLLAWAILGESPPGTALLGGALVMLGLAVAARGERSAFVARTATDSPDQEATR